MMQAARVAVKLEETMNTMKRLHGAGWDAAAEPYRAVLRGVMKDSGTDNVLGVALQIAKGMDAKGVSPAMLLAVAAEMASTENPSHQPRRTECGVRLDGVVGGLNP